MSFACTPAIPNAVPTLLAEPWKLAIKPFQVSPRTWYVSGQRWVGSYLINTGDGYILLDTGIPESLYLLVESLHEVGIRMDEIKLILLSHAHFDHFGAAAAMHELTGAPLYMSREDWRFVCECPEETYIPSSGSHVQKIHVDHFYDDDKPVVLGDIAIHTKLTPGHTIGCTSFFWEEKNPITGQVYKVAMHGGVGANTMNDDYYATSKYLKPSLRERFLADAESLKQIRVDIALPSHLNQIAIESKAGTYTDEGQPYVDDSVWPAFITERVRQVRVLMK